MSIRKHAMSAAFAAVFLGSAGSAMAQEGGVVIEIYVHDGETEVVCPTTACNAICRDIEGTQVLLQETFYRIGSNCSITITDGALLQDAIEVLLAFLGTEVPGGPGQGPPPTPPGLENAENNPNQNTVPPASGLPPGPPG